MDNTAYKVVIPTQDSQYFEITALKLSRELISNIDFQNIKILETANNDANQYKEIDWSNNPGDLHKMLNIGQEILNKLISKHETFMIASTTGYQIRHAHQIIYFEYINDKKQWMVFLNDNSNFLLKRNTSTHHILNYSSSFFKINNHHIINLEYLTGIDNKRCVFSIPLQNKQLTISRQCFKALQNRINLI